MVFELPAGAERPRLLRLDPAEKRLMVTVLGIRLRSAKGTLLWQWPAAEASPEQQLPVRDANPPTMALLRGMVLAATADPGFVLDITDEVLKKLKAKAKLELKANWQLFPLGIAATVLENRKND